jgi:cytochrome c-type biogenesis protein CcmE
MRRRDQRLIVIVAAGALVALAVGLTLMGLRDSVVYFYAPSEIAAKAAPGERVRLGGLVVQDSLKQAQDGVYMFAVSDGAAETAVRYEGILPDLFREGQGVVVEGAYQPGAPLEASRVLAKHDENYMPREVAEAIKARGEWKGPQE